MSTDTSSISSPQPWAVANRCYLDLELERMRLLLRRRVRWLQQQWTHVERRGYQGLIITDAEVDGMLCAGRAGECEFHASDAQAAALTASLEKVTSDIDEMGRTLAETGAAPAIQVLTRIFGLSAFERDVLLLGVAPELDASFERLFAYVQDDATRKHVTLNLALSLFAGEGERWTQARGSLMPDAVLRRLRLVTLDSGSVQAMAIGGAPLRVQERVLNYILGVNQIEERVAALLAPMLAAPLAPLQSEVLNRLHRRVAAEASMRSWPVVNLVGPPQSGKRALARALCDRIGLRLCELDVQALRGVGSERHELLRLLEREAALSQFALYIDTEPVVVAGQSDSGWSSGKLVEELRAFLILGSTEPWRTDRRMTSAVLPKLDSAGQGALWQAALGQVPNCINGELNGLVQQFEFGPTAVVQAVTAAQARARFRSSDQGTEVTPEDLWLACRDQAGVKLDATAERIVTCHSWDDIVLPKDVDNQLREIAAQVAHRPQVYQAWGFGAKLNRGRGISALFAGPSGTGKTMAAEILASHLNLDLYRIDLSGVVSKYIGETEKNLKRVFDAAEQGGAILFFDEADALFGKRSEVKDSHDRYANIEVNYLLQRMEDYRGLAILATNKKTHLDSAFMRRLRFLVDFPLPDATLRARIWQKAFPASAAVENLDFGALARLDIAGGNIKNIVLNAAFLAANEGSAIRMDQLFRAARREYTKIDKLIAATEFGAFGAAKGGG